MKCADNDIGNEPICIGLKNKKLVCVYLHKATIVWTLLASMCKNMVCFACQK
jgi:hypothetical protein